MKQITKSVLLFLFLTATFLTASAQSKSIKQFSFLMGNWEMKTKNGKITEHWKSTATTYEGASFKHNLNGDSTLTERIILKQIHGDWFFCVTGYEKGNTGTTNFRLISKRNNIFVFENSAHDFPQRINYQSIAKDKLFAWIEGNIEGKKMKIDFAYQRKK